MLKLNNLNFSTRISVLLHIHDLISKLFLYKKTFFVFPSVYMDKAVNNSYPNQNLVKVKTINFFNFFYFS